MENTTNSPQDSANCTSLVCPDPAHDDLTLDSEWSDEDRDCDGDGPHRDVEDQDVRGVRDDPDGQEDDEDSQDVQQVLLSFSGANAPEILRCTSCQCFVDL